MRDHLGQFQIAGNLNFARGIHLLDDCEGAMNWILMGTGLDPSVEFIPEAAFSGSHGMALTTNEIGPAENDTATAYKVFALPESGLIVFRFRFTCPVIATVKTVAISIIVGNGTDVWHARATWNQVTGAITYLNAAAAEVASGCSTQITNSMVWSTFELTIDTKTHLYKHISIGDSRVKDLNVSMFNTGASTQKLVETEIIVKAVAAAKATVYADTFYAGEFIDL